MNKVGRRWFGCDVLSEHNVRRFSKKYSEPLRFAIRYRIVARYCQAVCDLISTALSGSSIVLERDKFPDRRSATDLWKMLLTIAKRRLCKIYESTAKEKPARCLATHQSYGPSRDLCRNSMSRRACQVGADSYECIAELDETH